MTGLDSRAVAWAPVWDLLAPHLPAPGLVPGSPSWAALPDDAPAKWQALLWAAMWWVVAEDARQTGTAEVSKAIAASTDWRAVATEIRQLADARRAGTRIERKAG